MFGTTAVNRVTARVVTSLRKALQVRAALAADRRHNTSTLDAGSPDRILVVRHPHWHRNYNEPFLSWSATHAPDLLHRIELRRLPCHIRDWTRYALLVPWLQDPLRQRFPAAYRQASRLENACRLQGIPILNPVERLSIVKSEAAALMRAAGLRTPRMVRLTNVAARLEEPPLPFPFFVREDHLHGGPMALVRTPEEMRQLALHEFRSPVAVEFVDVRGADGLYRKHRYVVFGEEGVPRHLIVSRHWVVHVENRVLTPAIRAEEISFVREEGSPHHEAFVRASRTLGFDWAAFDYAYDRAGGLVVFEANPFPVLWTGANDGPQLAHLEFCRDRLFAAMARCLRQKADSVRLSADLRSTRRAV